MSKTFTEVLTDGFTHITDINDSAFLHQLRDEGVRVDDEGYHAFQFGDHKEYTLTIEPLAKDNQYQIALYKHNVTITLKLPVWSQNPNQES